MDIYASDEEKAEAIKQWWRDNGRSVIAGVILSGAVIFGYRYWMNYQEVQAQQAAAIYQQASIALSQDELADAEQMIETLMKDYSTTVYATFSAMLIAESKFDAGQLEDAEYYLDWAKDKAKLKNYRELVRLRLVRLLFAQNKLNEALSIIAEAETQAFSSLFAELEGDIKLAQGNRIAAYTAYQRALVELLPGDPREYLLEIKLDDVAKADEG